MQIRAFMMAAMSVTLWPALDASAAPQMLGVVASAEPVSMSCTKSACTVELSSFCLQEERGIPMDGETYQALDPGKLTLVVTGADGAVRRVSAAPYVQIASARGFSAVSISVSEAAAEKLGAKALAIVVAPRLTLVPEAQPDDPQPLTAGEIAQVRSSLSAVAADLFDADTPSTRQIKLMNRLINAVPGDERDEPGAIDNAWQRVMSGTVSTAQNDPAVAAATATYNYCRSALGITWPSAFRHCLQSIHDAELGAINADFWKIVRTGS